MTGPLTSRLTYRPSADGFVRAVRALAACSLIVVGLPAIASAVGSESGGMGLVRVDRAHSLPVTGFFVSFYAGMHDENAPGFGRPIRFTPSLTKGLGGGFEISGTLPIDVDSRDFAGELSRTLNVRGRDLLGNLRWTTPVGTSRLRLGAQGTLGWPLLSDKTRPGGTLNADNDFDLGLKGLLSMEFGSWNYPLQLHLNGGYWWSRNDGAFYYQDHPSALPLSVGPGQSNDVFAAGVALQGGLQRFMLFTELTTEQLLDARTEIRSGENLWRVTPGIRTKLTSSIAVTAALSFDVSKDSDRTLFKPDDVYPDVEFRLGLTLGQVLRRIRDVPPIRAETAAADATAPIVAAPSSAPAGRTGTTPSKAHEALAEPETPVWTDPVTVDESSAPHGPIQPDANAAARLEQMGARLDRIETDILLERIERRLESVENRLDVVPVVEAQPLRQGASAVEPAGSSAPQRPATLTPQPPATLTPQPPTTSAPQPRVPGPAATEFRPIGGTTPTPSRELELALRVAQLERELAARRATDAADRVTPPIGVTLSTPPNPIADLRSAPRGPDAATGVDPTILALRDDVDRELARSRALRHRAGGVEPRTSAVDTTAEVAAVPPVAAVTKAADGLPLAIGASKTLDIDLAADKPTPTATSLDELETWGRSLASNPSARLMVIVYGLGPNRDQVLAKTQKQADALRQVIEGAGAKPDQVVSLGLALSDVEGATPRAVIERVR